MPNQQTVNYIKKQKLPPVGNLLRRTWQIYKERIRVFLGIAIIPVLVSIPLIIILLAGVLLLPKNIWFLASFLAFYIPVMIILQLWAMLALLFAIKERSDRIGIMDSFRTGWHKILPYLWISVISSFLIVGGFLLFIIPGIIFSIWFSLAIYILISEDLRGMNALFRSKQLVKGYWWSVFGRFILIQIIAVVISLLIYPLIIVFRSPALLLLDRFWGLIVSFFFLPFSVTFSYLIYEDLKKLKKDVPFVVPERKTKIKYILIGIAGLLLLGLFLGLSLPFWKPIPPL